MGEWLRIFGQCLLCICLIYCGFNVVGTFVMMLGEMAPDTPIDGRIGVLHAALRKELTTLFLGLIAWGDFVLMYLFLFIISLWVVVCLVLILNLVQLAIRKWLRDKVR